MSTKSGSAVDFPAGSPSNFVLDRIAEPQCTQKLGTRVDQEPDVRVTEDRVVLGQFGDVRRVSNPSSATVADVDPALGLDVPPFWWGD
jgi:hypothetical protein